MAEERSLPDADKTAGLTGEGLSLIYLRLCSFGGYNAGIGYWGLGRDRCGFGDTLAARGEVVGLSRSGDGLDVTDEASVARVLGGVSGPFDLVMIATGALGVPEKSLRALSGQAMLAQFAVNAVGPALIIKHLLPLLPKDRETRVGVLSARVGSIGDNALGGWYSYRAAKAALNQVVHTAAIEVARSHPLAVLACLHPGKVATSFTAGYPGEKDAPGLSAARLLAVLDGLSPAESGRFYDYAGKIVAW